MPFEYVRNTSGLPNEGVYNDILSRLYSCTLFNLFISPIIHHYLLISLLEKWFLSIYIFFFTFFSLGPKTAEMYKNCEVNTSQIKKSTRIEMNLVDKKLRGCSIAEDIMDQCCHLSKFVGTVTSSRKIFRFRQCITFIKDFLNNFVNPLGIYPFNTFMTTEYSCLLLKLHIEEISNCLYDIYKMAKGIMFFLHSTDDLDTLNRSVRILYTFNYYFASFIEMNREFAPNHKKPQSMWRVR